MLLHLLFLHVCVSCVCVVLACLCVVFVVFLVVFKCFTMWFVFVDTLYVADDILSLSNSGSISVYNFLLPKIWCQ